MGCSDLFMTWVGPPISELSRSHSVVEFMLTRAIPMTNTAEGHRSAPCCDTKGSLAGFNS